VRSPLSLLALASLIPFVGCGTANKQDVIPGATGHPTTPMITQPSATPTGAGKAVGAKRLKDLDRQVLLHYAKKESKEAHDKVMQVVKEYHLRTAEECSAEEAKVYATLVVRLLAAIGKDLGKDAVDGYTVKAKRFAAWGGVSEVAFDKWSEDVIHETDDAILAGVAPGAPVVKVDQSLVDGLIAADAKAMKLLRSGDISAAGKEWMEVMKRYEKNTPHDCAPEEALAVGVIFARMAHLYVGNLPDEKVKMFFNLAETYSRKGGVSRSEYLPWIERLGKETKGGSKPK
jgi:hypothetical protein